MTEFDPLWNVRIHPPARDEHNPTISRWRGDFVVGGVPVGIIGQMDVSDQYRYYSDRSPLEDVHKQLNRGIAHEFGENLRKTFRDRAAHERRILYLEDRNEALTMEIAYLKVYINDKLAKKRWWRR